MQLSTHSNCTLFPLLREFPFCSFGRQHRNWLRRPREGPFRKVSSSKSVTFPSWPWVPFFFLPTAAALQPETVKYGRPEGRLVVWLKVSYSLVSHLTRWSPLGNGCMWQSFFAEVSLKKGGEGRGGVPSKNWLCFFLLGCSMLGTNKTVQDTFKNIFWKIYNFNWNFKFVWQFCLFVQIYKLYLIFSNAHGCQ